MDVGYDITPILTRRQEFVSWGFSFTRGNDADPAAAGIPFSRNSLRFWVRMSLGSPLSEQRQRGPTPGHVLRAQFWFRHELGNGMSEGAGLSTLCSSKRSTIRL